MAGGRRLGYPHERNHPGFIADREAVGGASLHAKITESRYGPRQGRSTARGGGDVRRGWLGGATCVDAWRARGGREGRWDGGSSSGAWTDGPKPALSCGPTHHGAVAATPVRHARALERQGANPTRPSTI
jgi:hypothetical protein